MTPEESFALSTLRSMIGDLQDHIDKRAADIAAPRILAAELEAREAADRAERDLAHLQQRWGDLEKELRLQIRFLQRRNDDLKQAAAPPVSVPSGETP